MECTVYGNENLYMGRQVWIYKAVLAPLASVIYSEQDASYWFKHW